ncbi:PAS domain S-box protein [Methanoplanus sp. FWC-SCC4]|uniref:histidine kinase n=1 Tax=Methanochimaera problematica TaxID=2609417 RepID=A0AA97FFR4_9EURY|nr:PAS domain S-box protein [Methanoplanus sp. FWC-SCC4]WOF17198.1 PAS domain S-box protein [Methanoplanus sp. FWC-SCC4]
MKDNYDILYVDDEDVLLEVTKLYLEKSGNFSVDTASSAKAGLNKIVENNYDAIVSDYEMPETDGIEFLKKVRSSGNDVPFIIFTGRGREDVVIDALNYGVDFYVQKGGQPKAQFAQLTNKITQAVRRKRAEKNLIHSELKYKALFNSTGAATVIVNKKGTILLSNAGYEKLSGYSCAELDGQMNWMDFVDEKTFKLMTEKSDKRNAFSSSYHDSYEFKFNDRFGRIHDILLIIEAIKYSENFVCNLIDITEQKKVQNELLESQNKLKTILNTLPEIIVQKDSNLKILWANNAAKELNPNLIGRTCYDAFLGRRKPCKDCNALNALESGEIMKKTIFNEQLSGKSESYWEKTSIPIMDSKGNYSLVVEFTKDITSNIKSKNKNIFKQNLAEKLVITSRLDDALNIIFESLITVRGIDSGILFLKNEIKGGLSLVRSIGITEEYKISVDYLAPESSCMKRLHHKRPIYGDFDDISPNMMDISKYEGFRSFAYLPITDDAEIIGAFFLISHNNSKIADFSKEILESANDIIGSSLSRIITEEQLRESKEKLSIALKSAELFVWEYYIEDKVIKWNNNLLKSLGYFCNDVVEAEWWSSLVHPDDQENRIKKINSNINGDGDFYSGNYRVRASSGEWKWLNLLGKTTERNSCGNATRIVGVIQDITEIKENENALKIANKKLNLLSSITRHDIINQLTPAFAYLEMCRDSAENNEEILNYLNNVENHVNVIGSQISFTKDYQDLGLEMPRWQDIKTIVEQSKMHVDLSNIKLDLSDISKNILIYADPMFEKIFFNLLDNSVRHGENVSEISIFCKKDEESIKIIYSDNGAGIPFDIKNKIFLKGFGKNTGLGLFLTKEILEITKITIEETGIPGKCARFEISVPGNKWKITE